MKKGLILLDSAPLGYFCHSKNSSNHKKFRDSIKDIEYEISVPEIIDYEVRRNFEFENLRKSLNILSQFHRRGQITYLRTEDLIHAARLWAWCRKEGQATTENKGIDIDVILVSQALSQLDGFEKVVILTVDIGDLSVFSEWGVSIWNWKTALSDCELGQFDFL